jgi:hypothetical protein
MKALSTPATRHALLLCILGCASFAAAPSEAIDLLVSHTGNTGPGSLRQAVNDSNATSGTNRIIFAPGVTGTITLTSGELVISTNATILGPGPGVLTVSGNFSSRVFNISGGTAVISGLTIGYGGASGGDGGGVVASASLSLSNCLFTANFADKFGGAVSSSGNLAVENCAFVYNTALNQFGGALYLTGTTVIRNTTIVSNACFWDGGGIYNSGDLTVLHCTIVGNRCTHDANDAYGGGLKGSASVGGTIIAGNTSPSIAKDVHGSFTSLGFNLIGQSNGSSGWGSLGDQIGTTANPINPELYPFGNYGGPTPTTPPIPFSPVIDQGKNFGADTDQRERPRTYDNPAVFNATLGDGTDIGAVEYGPLTWVVTNSNNSGPGSLRQAVLDAAPTEDDTITFAPSVTNTITLTSGEIVMNKVISIVGPGANRLSVSGNANNRVFNVQSGRFHLSGLTLTNGNAAAGLLGGNVLIQSPIFVEMRACRVTHGEASEGGGIWNAGTLYISECTVDGNTTAGAGAGLANHAAGTISALNCTIASNSSGDQNGVAIFNNGSLTLNSCTVASNTISLAAGRAVRNQNTAVIANTIIASNCFGNGTDVSGAFISSGYNLIGVINNSTGFGATGDQLNANPLLGPMGNYGGPTPTMALRFGSPAIDKGSSFSQTNDQRVVARPLNDLSIPNASGGDGTDIGAFEVDPNFRIVDMRRVGNNVALSLMTVLGRNYRVEHANVLAPGNWTAFTNNAPGNGYLLWVTNSGGADQPRRFYRGAIVP